jgi:hypothetical protein
MLFSDWDARKGIPVSVDDEINTELAVRELALEVFNSGEEEFGESWLRDFLTTFYMRLPGSNPVSAAKFAGSAMGLWRGRKWLITYVGTKHGEDTYTFTHRTFLEYFAALQLVYASRTAAELCRALEPLFLQRSSLTFCLLSVQSFCAGKLHAGSDFLGALLETVNKLRSEEYPREAYNALDFGLQTLPFMDRADNDLRLSVTGAMSKLIADLIPFVTVEDYHRNPGVVLDTDIWEFELEHRKSQAARPVRVSKQTFERGSGVVEMFNTYSRLAHLKRSDVENHLATIKTTIEEKLRQDFLIGFRMCVALFFSTWSPSWTWTGGRTTLRRISIELLREEPVKGVYEQHVAAPDYWSLVGGLAMGVDFDAKWIAALDLADLSKSVSYIDIPNAARVSLAHLLCGSILQWRWSSDVAGELTTDSVKLLLERAVATLLKNLDAKASRSVVASGAEAHSIQTEELAEEERFVVVALLGILNGTRGFVDSVLKESEQSDLVESLGSALRFRASPGVPPLVPPHPASWNKPFPTQLTDFRRLVAHPEHRRALYRFWDLGPPWQLFEDKLEEEQRKVANIARATASQLAAQGEFQSIVEVERDLVTGPDGRRAQYADAISPAVLIVRLATLGWQVYADYRTAPETSKKLSKKILADRIREQSKNAWPTHAAFEETVIDFVADQAIREGRQGN